MTGDETKDASGYAISERVHETYDQHGQHSMALDAACRVAVAEELRRLVADTSIEGAIGRWRLIERANALDPEGVPEPSPEREAVADALDAALESARGSMKRREWLLNTADALIGAGLRLDTEGSR